MRSLVRWMLAVGALAALSTSLAMTFEENAVDFQNPDITTLYVTLDSGPSGLAVALSSVPAPGYVSTLDVDGKLTDFEGIASDIFTSGDIAKYLGTSNWAAKAFPHDVELANQSSAYSMIRLHQNEALPDVLAAYTTRLTRLGYSVSEQTMTSNITVVTATMGGETVRVVFSRAAGNDTWVTLSTPL